MAHFIKNRGVLPYIPKISDWGIGAESKIIYEVRNPSGDWTPYLVRGEKQFFKTFDTMACVSYATNNVAEIQIKFLTGIEVNFSDRYLAKQTGTTHEGNMVTTVVEYWRKYGCVLEDVWPQPPEPASWANYYSSIPQSVVDQAASVSVNKYKLEYAYIPDHAPEVIRYHLKQSPVLITIPGHEITGIVVSADNEYLTILDHYEFSSSFTRRIKISDITDIFKVVLTLKDMPNQTRLVLGKDGKTVYEATPVAMSFEEAKKQWSVEGIEVPNPIPPASTLP